MRTLIGALLAMTALVPVAAQAQEGRRGWRSGAEARADVAVDARARGPERVRGQGDAGAFRQDRRDRVPGDPQAFRDNRAAPGGFRGDDRRDARQDGRRPRDDQRGPRVGWGGGNPGWSGGNAGWGGGQGRGGDWGGNDWDRSSFNQRNRGDWNRDWRNDRRYDWNRYRGDNRAAYRLPRYYAPGGWGGYRRLSIGVGLGAALWGSNYWIADPFAYRLPEAWGPYRWVRYYDDALLVDVRRGVVVDAVYGIFW